MALSITITDAGRAALINAQNTGSTAMVIDRIGVSASHATGNLKALTTLPNERKKLATFAGEVVADDMIHVTVRDETNDAYDLRAFGIYFANGVLFAVCTQAEPIMQKATAAMLLQSVDIALVTLDTANIEFGGAGFSNPPATTERLGVVELATEAETAALEDATRAVTPFSLGRTLLAWAQNFASRMHNHDIADVNDLGLALAGKAAKDHKHDAADTTSGTFDVARIPKLAISWINGLADTLATLALKDHKHDAADIISGILAVGRIPALGMEKITGLAVELASKASLAGAIFTGAVRVRSGTQGYVELNSGNAFRPGLIAFSTPDNTRRGYVGFAASDEGGELVLQGETGWTWRFSHRPKFGTATPWDTANFDPAGKVNKAGDIMTGPLTVPEIRLKATGTGSGNTYGALISKYYGDDNYGIGFVGWRGGIGWTEVGSIDHLGRFLVNGHRVWTAETFDPNTKATLGANALFYDVIAARNTSDGVYFFGSTAGRWLAYTNGRYELIGSGGLTVNGYQSWTAENLKPASAADTLAGTGNDKFISPAALWSFAKSIGPSGYAQIPGTPIIMQWGSSNASLIEGQVTALLPIAFGGGCFFAAATPRNAASEPWADFMMQVVAKYLDRIIFFAQRGYDGRNTSSGFEWLALGFATGTPNAVFSAGGGTGGGGGGGGGGELNPEQ